jgi:hypothetical protein
VVTRSAWTSLSLRPSPWLGVVATVAFAPDLGQSSLTRATRDLISANALSPSVSKTGASGSFSYELTPIRVPGRVSSAVHVGLGLAALHTRDDLEGLDLGPQAELDQSQLHLGWTTHASADVLFGHVGVRARITRLAYTEQFAGQSLDRAPWSAALGAIYAF